MADPHGKIKKQKHAKKQFSADHIFIHIYFRMHHFVVKFSKFSSPQVARATLTPVTKTLGTPLQRAPATGSKQSQVAPTYVLLFDLSHLFAVHTSLLLALLLFLFLSLFLLKSLLLHQLLHPAQHPPRLTARHTATTLPKAGQRLY